MSDSRPASFPLPWSLRAERVAIVGFWAFLALLDVLRRTADPFRPGGDAATIGDALAGTAVFALWAVLTPLVFGLARRLPLIRGTVGRRLAVHVGAALAVAVIVEAVNFLVLRATIGPPPVLPGRGLANAPGLGEIVTRLWFLDELLLYLGVLAVGFARSALVSLRAREREAAALQEERAAFREREATLQAEQATLRAEHATLEAERAGLEAQLADARLAALRGQLNPHFLFNTLHAVGSLADEDPAAVQHLVARLSSLLRRTLENTLQREIPLAEELSFIGDYLAIQEVRFSDTLRVRERIDPATRDALVPALVLQPLVENAFEHAFSANGGGLLTISARLDGSQLVLGVRDDGPGLPAADGASRGAATKGRGGIGLRNAHERLETLYGDAARLDLVEPEDGGLLVAVTLPYHTAADLRATAAS